MLNAFAVYIAAHFLLYALALRKLPVFRTERGIFLYHFAPAVLVSLAALACAVVEQSQFGIPGLVLVLSAHGIYSMSFLELWSLAQGGYSLSVVASVAKAEAAGTKAEFSALEALGETKQRERLAGLERLGLVATTDGRIALTARGGRIAFLLHALRRWVEPGGRSEG